MKIKSMAIAMLLTISSGIANAQTAEIPNVLKIRNARSNGTIKKQNEIAGYYTFYFKEKADKKNSAYEVRISDNELNTINTFELVRPKATILMETVYNGEALMFFFYDQKTGYEFVTYSLDGKKLGSSLVTKDAISMFDLQATIASSSSEGDNTTMYPVEGEGFVRQRFTKNKKMAFEIARFDNKAKEVWTYSSAKESKLVEYIDVNEVTDKYVTATVYRKKSLMTNKANLAFLILDVNTGKLIAELPMGNEDEGKKSVVKSFVDNQMNKIVLIGEYYDAGDDIYKDKSQGLYVQDVSFDGKILGETEYSWKTDIAKFMKETMDEEDKKDKRPYNFFWHDVIRGANGHLYLIGEQYKKQISAAGVGLGVLASATGGDSNVAAIEVLIANMVVVELGAKNELTKIDIVPKRKTRVQLEQGAGMVSIVKLGLILKAQGDFDYSFTSREKDADKFTVIYTDGNRKEEKGSTKSDVMLGVIHVENGAVKNDRIGVNFDSWYWWIRQAKPGFILLGEYARKEKVIKLRLEQVAY
ncbi:MAG: DUF6770 family protein [Bacteroidota bacterium]